MIGQAYILSNPSILSAKLIGLIDLDSSLLAYRDARGAITYFSDQEGMDLLDCILAGACVITKRGNVVQYDEAVSPQEFLATVISRAGICFYHPDETFFGEARKMPAYDAALQKAALYKKYGRPLQVPQKPLLETIGVEGLNEKDVVDWVLNHCAAFAVWQCTTGAERQPILFGRDRQSKVDAIKSLCELRRIKLMATDKEENLPNW